MREEKQYNNSNKVNNSGSLMFISLRYGLFSTGTKVKEIRIRNLIGLFRRGPRCSSFVNKWNCDSLLTIGRVVHSNSTMFNTFLLFPGRWIDSLPMGFRIIHIEDGLCYIWREYRVIIQSVFKPFLIWYINLLHTIFAHCTKSKSIIGLFFNNFVHITI